MILGKKMATIIIQCKERQKEIGMFNLLLFHTDFIIYVHLYYHYFTCLNIL